jgi:hypothetical protein
MRIISAAPREHGVLYIVSEDGRAGTFDVRPYLDSPSFRPLKDREAFASVRNGGYFVEWGCGADLSADTIEAHWQIDQTDKLLQRTEYRR